MNLLLIDHSEKDKDLVSLSDERAKHIREVLKLGEGDSLRVGQIDGLVGEAEILQLNQVSVQLKVRLTDEPPPASKVKVLLALPRPKVLGRKLRSLAELGVKDVYLINANKVESSYWTAHQLREDQMRKHLLSGLSQSYDTVLPRVHFKKGFRPFVEDELPDHIDEHEAWVAHPYAEKAISPSDSPTYLAIGPEGGWVDFELELFERVGFQIGHGGRRVLSTETAIVSLVSKFQ